MNEERQKIQKSKNKTKKIILRPSSSKRGRWRERNKHWIKNLTIFTYMKMDKRLRLFYIGTK